MDIQISVDDGAPEGVDLGLAGCSGDTTGSGLEIVPRAQDIDTLILTGISTGGVVLSTVREAADKDFRIVVLADGCLDPDPEFHAVLTEKIFLAKLMF
jgi:nicotinamidase-related amidase